MHHNVYSLVFTPDARASVFHVSMHAPNASAGLRLHLPPAQPRHTYMHYACTHFICIALVHVHVIQANLQKDYMYVDSIVICIFHNSALVSADI